MSKICKKCLVKKSLIDFYKHEGCRGGFRLECKKCTSAYLVQARKIRKKNDPVYAEKIREGQRRRDPEKHLKNKYGITLKQYEQLFKGQKGVCAICGQPEKVKNRWKSSEITRLSVDHNHITKKVRGLLCRRCNVGIGHFDESIEFLLKAIKYLRKEIL